MPPSYLGMMRTKRNLVRGDFGYPVNTDGFGGILNNYSRLCAL